MTNRSVKFTAVDGREYKWELHGILDGHAKVSQISTALKNSYNLTSLTQLEVEGRTAAVYDRGSKHLFSANEPPTLRIYPEALSSVEDIITMLAYLVKRRDVTSEEVAVAAA